MNINEFKAEYDQLMIERGIIQAANYCNMHGYVHAAIALLEYQKNLEEARIERRNALV